MLRPPPRSTRSDPVCPYTALVLSSRASTANYTTQCTVLITYLDGDREDRLVYERPQTQVPAGPLSTFDRIRISQFPTDDELTIEARTIFADMKRNEIGRAHV